MKKNRTDNPYVICPYFRSEDHHTIFCEGPEEKSSIHIAFSTPQLRKAYQVRFCKGCWNRCLIGEGLNRKWEYKV